MNLDKLITRAAEDCAQGWVDACDVELLREQQAARPTQPSAGDWEYLARVVNDSAGAPTNSAQRAQFAAAFGLHLTRLLRS